MLHSHRALTLTYIEMILAMIATAIITILITTMLNTRPIKLEDKIIPIYVENQIVKLLLTDELVQILEIKSYNDYVGYIIRNSRNFRKVRVRESELISDNSGTYNAVISNNRKQLNDTIQHP